MLQLELRPCHLASPGIWVLVSEVSDRADALFSSGLAKSCKLVWEGARVFGADTCDAEEHVPCCECPFPNGSHVAQRGDFNRQRIDPRLPSVK
jgi:hypothetical protein